MCGVYKDVSRPRRPCERQHKAAPSSLILCRHAHPCDSDIIKKRWYSPVQLIGIGPMMLMKGGRGNVTCVISCLTAMISGGGGLQSLRCSPRKDSIDHIALVSIICLMTVTATGFLSGSIAMRLLFHWSFCQRLGTRNIFHRNCSLAFRLCIMKILNRFVSVAKITRVMSKIEIVSLMDVGDGFKINKYERFDSTSAHTGWCTRPRPKLSRISGLR